MTEDELRAIEARAWDILGGSQHALPIAEAHAVHARIEGALRAQAAEVRRLRVALESIAAEADTAEDAGHYLLWAAEAARAALGEQP